ncbi:hypothetical protein HBI56_079360 [Parastagonospora nodorum]|uniref:Uncharacterized protein n=1 Tax=Phaeosphaeria nodorum (strain SN15 / ATCC MYA-4574 / FGSC 10173) TaxID=321614 RepID=A0A7U2I7G3_PHANO|nr:hypothetical protein HBH56_107410 [Parastagonospora nodorum]QRD04910.1 hypothetical protein JI435_108240 [Parastagonospora nodorum SN15]KAH3929480.1 hypothetical protein HBH54_123010 [Parastagonospora nodorum]KAH3951679.1 hypothetical protein HBH53_056980 [Parastagonospora nodorum]KAH3975738.1 hypothetical protein HBH52_129780 [Parastagonospora nodorum]
MLSCIKRSKSTLLCLIPRNQQFSSTQLSRVTLQESTPQQRIFKTAYMAADTPAAYPGLGLDIRYGPWTGEGYGYPHGAINDGNGTESELLYVRELAMMNIMDKLTDKPDWHKKVFDEEIVAKWRKEALAIPDEELYKLAHSGGEKMPENILNENTVDCCIKELRSKAKYFEQTGIVPTMEACASIAKSDTLVTQELHEALRRAFDQLKLDQQASPDWHPNSQDMVQDLVHPSMYPLVFGRTRAFPEECVGVEDAIKTWAGKGTIIPKEEELPSDDNQRRGLWNREVDHYSSNYQWLPANVAFQDDGSVKLTSYINNLHPNKYPEIYRTIEKLVETTLPLWDQCLSQDEGTSRRCAGRTCPRLALVDNPDDECEANWIPDNMDACADLEVDEDALEEEGYYPYDDDEDGEQLKEYKWRVVRKPKLPEPVFKEIEYAPKEGTRLIDRFKETGLQIIVKMASIELDPQKAEFPTGSWHVEGQLNEHICGTALYYLDSENITDNNLSFRMLTSEDLGYDSEYAVGQQSYSWMESVFGTSLGSGGGDACLQNYGSVQTRQGRLLAFPNTFQHQVSSFKLIDPAKPGHRRFIALWLVDPHMRIISTANVPPQQMSWYAENLLGTTAVARKQALAKLPAELVAILQERGLLTADNIALSDNAKLPAELLDMVRGYVDAEGHALPMGIEEAREHRVKLMEERSRHVRNAEQAWESSVYSFCEH